MTISVTTELLGELPALSKISTREAMVATWIRGGEGLVGFGEYQQLVITGPRRFEQAQQWWQEQLANFSIKNHVHGSGTGPILFTSFAFDENEPSILVIPKIVIARKKEDAWITWIGEQTQPEITDSLTTLESVPPQLHWSDGGLDQFQWQDRVSEAISEIKSGKLEKVVLARELIAEAQCELNLTTLVQTLEENYPTTWVFLVDGLIGATPELLVRLNKSLVTSRVLAGTIRKSGDEERDLALAASLAKSSKDLEEHEYAVRSVAEAIAPFCSSTNVPESPFVLHLQNVMHLATDVTGVINESATRIDIFSLLARLHPSAAVCGTPTDKARDLIRRIEGLQRGRYAGPIGWIDRRGDGELGIALRCGQISEDHRSMNLYAGCGIVAGSDPIKEYAESNAKFLAMRNALESL